MQLNLTGERDKSKSMATENNHQPSFFFSCDHCATSKKIQSSMNQNNNPAPEDLVKLYDIFHPAEN
jgi:hypothetical protein